ncbi:MAG: protease modulator HflC [Deltaproteobacteria bacterium]|nr:protease modulator HflC [Deltaproteobacteria bacterium]
MNRSYITGILVGAVVVVLLFPPVRPFFVVGEWQQSIVTQFGKFKRAVREPGLHWKTPLLEDVTMYERRILASDAQPRDYLTLDKKRVIVDHVTRWRISDPFQFFKTALTEQRGRLLLDDIVFSELRQELASRNFAEIIAEQREAAMEAVAKRSAEKAKSEYGVTVVDVRVKRADLPSEVQTSVFERMRAERERIAKRYRSEGEEESKKIRAQTDKEKTILLAEAYRESQKLRGEGDGAATAIYADSYGQDPEFYSFTRSLEAYEKFLPEKSTAILSEGSPLFRHLGSAQIGELPAVAAPAAVPQVSSTPVDDPQPANASEPLPTSTDASADTGDARP